MPIKRIQADLLLLFVALIWGMAFAAQRSAAPLVGVWWFNAVRFLLAGIMLAPLLLRKQTKLTRANLSLVILTGLVLAGASGLQQAGLQFTTAANAGFITSLYVVLVPILGLLIFRRKTRLTAWLAAIIAMIGAGLLSIGGQGFQLMVGDLLEFFGAILWAFHVILIDKVVKKVDVFVFATIQYFIAGFIQMILGIFFEPGSLPLLREVWWAIAYTGIVSVGIGYTLQAVAQKHAPPVDAAILLSMEAVFAALGGYLFLKEALQPLQIVGCAMIFFAVILAQVRIFLSTRAQDTQAV
jgi:drug/metabolite transporter (DMT)-like permease